MTPDSQFTDQRLHIDRLDGDADANYRVYSPTSRLTTVYAGWLSFQPSGIPFAFGDGPSTLELGGTAAKSVEYAVEVTENEDGEVHAVGARIRLGEDAK